MNKFLAMSAIIFNLMIISQIVNANPRDSNGSGHSRQAHRDGASDGYMMEERRREREERGVRRLQQHKWQAGYVMPQHYRGDGYKVDFRENNLPKPSRNQQWYKINNDYILVDSEDNSIIQIMGL
ncbi:RcnB family protein [Acinetobacter pullicarnis]|uniref:RcnB family protein n=1 Tax=Acinetobacter pullicarnis TaxID=2576829 RepID=UPI00111FD392|nr:RcnB family protein [Acinetobacter pullicarnis]